MSPIPRIAAILMLPGRNARTTNIGFAIGWPAGIVVAAIDEMKPPAAPGIATAMAVVSRAIGVALIGKGVWAVS
ncbi:hypothetical protein [Gordonia terrae]